jgi:hypothetical protein
MSEQTMVQADPNKFKLTCLIPKDLMKKVRQNTVDYETNITSAVIEALEDYLKKYPEKRK